MDWFVVFLIVTVVLGVVGAWFEKSIACLAIATFAFAFLVKAL